MLFQNFAPFEFLSEQQIPGLTRAFKLRDPRAVVQIDEKSVDPAVVRVHCDVSR